MRAYVCVRICVRVCDVPVCVRVLVACARHARVCAARRMYVCVRVRVRMYVCGVRVRFCVGVSAG